MASDAVALRVKRMQEIIDKGRPASSPCKLCKEMDHECIFWTSGQTFKMATKCAYCVQRGKPCVGGRSDGDESPESQSFEVAVPKAKETKISKDLVAQMTALQANYVALEKIVQHQAQQISSVEEKVKGLEAKETKENKDKPMGRGQTPEGVVEWDNPELMATMEKTKEKPKEKPKKKAKEVGQTVSRRTRAKTVVITDAQE